MKYKFRYFSINNHYTHLAIAKNFPEAKFIDEYSMPDLIEFDIKRYPHCTGQWKEIDINYLTVIWYQFVFGKDWKMQIEYELTEKFRNKEEIRIGEITQGNKMKSNGVKIKDIPNILVEKSNGIF